MGVKPVSIDVVGNANVQNNALGMVTPPLCGALAGHGDSLAGNVLGVPPKVTDTGALCRPVL